MAIDSETITLLVTEDSQDTRLDKFIAEALSEQFSRERIKQLILDGHVQVNTLPVQKPASKLNESDQISLHLPPNELIALEAEDIPLEVLFEDDCMLVVNKPPGMLTHPTGKTRNHTLVNALLAHCKGSLSGINGQIRPGIVHRLDRDTSGLLMVAKTDLAHRHLSEQLKQKTARREYRALVQGCPKQPNGSICQPIGRNPTHRDKMMISPSGRTATTHWRILESVTDKITLLHLQLETGRTHQIRVHLAHLGYPVLGDPLYGTGVEKLLKLPTSGQLLQAFRLTYTHPLTQQEHTIEIPMEERLLTAIHYLQSLP